jgi:hypothetical protein
MYIKRWILISLAGCFVVFSCQTKVEPVSGQMPVFLEAEGEKFPAAAEPGREAEAGEFLVTVDPVMEMEDEPFDPLNVSQQLFDSTLVEVQNFITSVNNIIHSRRYEDWVKSLSQEYIDTYSSPDYLRKVSEEPLFKSKKIVLTDFRDFFMHNVVPSRVNIDKVNVDDIEFITPVRVKAFTINAKGQRLRLYELEKVENAWKIVN